MTDLNIQHMVQQYQSVKVTEQTKLREILQQTALLGLERHGFFEKVAFYGGTALRILYGLDRFSEDLDFTLLQPNPNFDFTKIHSIDWNSAKADMRTFIADPSRLD